MGLDRTKIVEAAFLDFINNWPALGSAYSNGRPAPFLQKKDGIEIFESQLTSRLLDYQARELKNAGLGFYTIGSAGHEGNAVLGRLLRPTDPALLHYRSGAWMIERARKGNTNIIDDILLSMCASKEDPVSGGRHKVWGSRPLWVPPQTSTIASHLPKSVGMAWAIERAKQLKLDTSLPQDAIVFCSFGDASCNHASALTAFNSAQWTVFQNLPLPIVFCCEDNGIGISVKTPTGWIEEKFSSMSGIEYVQADGLDFVNVFEKAQEAIEICRLQRKPVFFHMKTIRLFGHAGSDVETTYLSQAEIEAIEKKDPLIQSAAILLENNWMSPSEISDMYLRLKKQIAEGAEVASRSPKLKSSEEVMEPLFRKNIEQVARRLREPVPGDVRQKAFASIQEGLPEAEDRPRHMAYLINQGLKDLMVKYPNMVMFGEDVAKKGGVYNVTADLMKMFGIGRVFNTLLDETTILGLAAGAGHLGFLPVPEIQYLAYYHNAEDQIRGEAASLSFFSKQQFQNPMVVRIASFAYQKGFGGHFHNDHSVAALLDVPGIIIATPSRGDDAVTMMRTCMAHAMEEGRVVLFLEPIALYMQKDLHQPGDGNWQFYYPYPNEYLPMHQGGVYRTDSRDVLIVSYANGLHMSLQAARILERKHGINVKVFDLRWLKPFPLEHLAKEAKGFQKILFVDECREFGGVSEILSCQLRKRLSSPSVQMSILQSKDTYLPLGPAAQEVLVSTDQIVESVRSMM